MPRGRPRTPDAPRYKSGRINRNALAKVDDPRAQIVERRARQWGMAVNDMTRPWLLDQRHGSNLGIMALRGERSPIAGIDADQYEAGRYVWRAVTAYQRLVLGMTLHPAVPPVEMIPDAVQAPDDDSSTARAFETLEERVKRTTSRYMAVLQSLGCAGHGVRQEVLAVCVEDRTCENLDRLKRGLDAVFKDFGLG